MNIKRNSLFVAASTLLLFGTAYTGVAGSCGGHRHQKDVTVTCAGGCTTTAECGSAACPVAKAAKADAERVECNTKKCGGSSCGSGCSTEKCCGRAACPVAADTSKDDSTEQKKEAEDSSADVSSVKSYATVSSEQLQSLLASREDVVVLDARSGRFDDGRRIPGARQLSPDAPEKYIVASVPDKDVPVVVYCSNEKCPAGDRLAQRLVEHGFRHVHKLPEGIDGWEGAGHPVEKN